MQHRPAQSQWWHPHLLGRSCCAGSSPAGPPWFLRCRPRQGPLARIGGTPRRSPTARALDRAGQRGCQGQAQPSPLPCRQPQEPFAPSAVPTVRLIPRRVALTASSQSGCQTAPVCGRSGMAATRRPSVRVANCISQTSILDAGDGRNFERDWPVLARWKNAVHANSKRHQIATQRKLDRLLGQRFSLPIQRETQELGSLRSGIPLAFRLDCRISLSRTVPPVFWLF